MNRRNALKTAAAAAGAGLVLGPDGAARIPPPPPPPARRGHRERAPFVEAQDGTPLFFRDWGSGPPVVFLHGWSLHSAFWQYQMVALADRGFRAVAYDRRGHGRSGDPGRGYDYDTLADDLATILERVGLRDVTLVGHSMGAGEIVRYLSRHGRSRVARAVLVGATLPFLMRTADNPDGIDAAFFDAWRRALSTDWGRWQGENEAPFWTPETSPRMKEWGRSLPQSCSLQAAIACTRAITETDFRAELRALPVRTLLVHGTEDRSVYLRYARAAAQIIPNGRLEEYVGAPHGLPLTHMERFNRDLLGFVGS